MTSWLLSHATELSRRERILISLSGLIPDLDGAGYIVDTLTPIWGKHTYYYQQYHHIIAHNFLFALLASLFAAFLAKQKKTFVAGLVFISVNLHILFDLIGSKGPDGHQWGMPYFYPWSDKEWVWKGQWELNAWPNILIAFGLVIACITVSYYKRTSPFEIISTRLNEVVFEIGSSIAAVFSRIKA